MDIYRFINSPDVADYCREINKVWTPFEMAVIIGRSERPMSDKHMAWRELMTDYPDMPMQKNMHYNGDDSLHKILSEEIAYEECVLALFKTSEPGTIYQYTVKWRDEDRRSDSVYTSFEKTWADLEDNWEGDNETETVVEKIYVDDNCGVEVYFGSDREIHNTRAYGEKDRLKEWFSGIDIDSDALGVMNRIFYVDIPLPFKLGDILTIRYGNGKDPVFILEPHNEEDKKRRLRLISEGKSDGSDMNDWGLYVSDDGVLYGDHTGAFDSFEYYRGKLSSNDRLLHYVSLYLKGEIRMPELLVMQGRIMLEYQLNSVLGIHNHGCCIPDSLLAENRLTPEEKEEIQNTNGLMPWIAGKLSIHQVEFLVREFGGDNESVQTALADGGGCYLSRCAGIVHDENYYAKINDTKFNPARRDMARIFLEVYGYKENGWVDSHAER